MKCRKCEAAAVIHMRQHKLALCRGHFLDWIPEQTQRAIDTYEMFPRDARILVAVSGGKDSLALWDVLLQLGYAADGLYIDTGIDEGIAYAQQSRLYAQQFADQHALGLRIVDIPEEEGTSVAQAALITRRDPKKTCSVCGLTKRHAMNHIARTGRYDVIVTGHNLDDEAAVLFGNTLNWKKGYLVRQEPVLPATASGFARKAKPFCRLYEREIAAYAFLRGIAYMPEECPFAKGATSLFYKETLNRMETSRPGTKLSFYLSYLKAKSEGLFTARPEKDAPENACRLCGQPTFHDSLCAYCTLWERVRQALPSATEKKNSGSV